VVADAVAAEGAEAAEDAAAAEVVDAAVVAAAAAEAAACRGALAACARLGRVPNTLTNAGVMAGFDEVDPANSRVLGGPSNVWLARRAHDGRADRQPIENGQRALDQGVPMPGECTSQGRSGVASNMRVMTS
jgi:hypothetical protein